MLGLRPGDAARERLKMGLRRAPAPVAGGAGVNWGGRNGLLPITSLAAEALLAPPRPHSFTTRLLLVDQVPAPVLLPALFVFFGAERFFLAVADGLDAVSADTSLHQGVAHGTGAIVAEGKVVLGGTAAVAVSLNGEANVGMLLEEINVALQGRLLVAPHVVLVVVEEDVFHALGKHFFLGLRRGGRRWRRRSGDGDPRRGLLGAAGSLGHQVIGGGVGRGDLLRAAGLDRADAVNADVGGVGGFPGQG